MVSYACGTVILDTRSLGWTAHAVTNVTNLNPELLCVHAHNIAYTHI